MKYVTYSVVFDFMLEEVVTYSCNFMLEEVLTYSVVFDFMLEEVCNLFSGVDFMLEEVTYSCMLINLFSGV